MPPVKPLQPPQDRDEEPDDEVPDDEEPAVEPEKGDRWIIALQLLTGVLLIVFGGLMAVVFPAAETIGTAVIGAGAALLPAGAAAAASTRASTRATARARATTRPTSRGTPRAGRARR